MSVNNEKDPEEIEFHESNCIECDEVDTLDMVQCDECDRWAHFQCVGVGPEIKDSDWCCRICSTTLSGLSLSDSKLNASVGKDTESAHSHSSACPNVAVGAQANVAVGVKANVAVGAQANVAVGAQANVAVGAQANVAVGAQANVAVVAQANVAVGAQANVAVGAQANVAVGAQANVAVGAQANVAVGAQANVAVGAQANVAVGAQALPADDSCLKLVKEENDLPVVHRSLDDEKVFELYVTKFAKFGGADMKETVREIGQQMISDSVLMKYSYLGRREKFRFKDYDNLTRLVVASSIASMKMKYFSIHGKAMVQTNDEKEKHYKDVEKYFTTEYLRKAGIRHQRSLK